MKSTPDYTGSSVEADMPTESASPNLVTKGFVTDEINLTPGERSMVAWISTDQVDLEGDVVVSAGVDYGSYLENNPIVVAIHDLGKWPIGQCKWIKLKRNANFNGLVAKSDFDDDPDTEIIWRKVSRRTVRSVSIGFMPPDDLKPGEWGPPTPEEIRRRPDWAKARRIIRRCVLKEYSVCPIGMNPAALIVAVSKGFHRPNHSDAKVAGVPQTTPSFDLVVKSGTAKGDSVTSALVTPADARVMIGLAIPPDIASTLAIPGGEPPEELHVALCYLGRAIEVGTRAIDRIQKMCRAIASYTPPLKGSISGVGRFSASSTSDGKDVVYASADLPDLTDFRQRLADNVRWEGVEYSRAHGFTPHVTLAYVDPDAESPVKRVTPSPVEFLSLSLWVDGERTDFPFDTGAYANGGPVGYLRSTTDIEAKGMNDDELEDDEKTCTCGKAECEKCTGMAEGSSSTGGATVKPKADEPDEEDDEDMENGNKAMTDEEEQDEPETDAEEEEDEEDDEDDDPEEIGPLKRYDHVSIKSPHYKGVGRIESLHRCGHVPHSSNHMMGTKDDPAACVKCYRKMGDGHVPTDDHVAVKVAHITKLGSPLTAPSKKSSPPVAKKTVRTEPIVEPLPAIVVKSDQEVRAELITKLNQMLSPEGFRKIAREEAERAAGYV